MEALEAKKTQTLEPVYSRRGQAHGQSDIGNSYVEIDIARQQLWFYKEGQLIMETPVVTGDITKGSGTETGTGMIWSRETNRYLTGQTWNSFVSYWMPFNWSGEGLHDASWRGSFGGQIYKGNGSNGCVNMPPPVVGQFFKETYIGLPVVVYNSDTQKIS